MNAIFAALTGRALSWSGKLIYLSVLMGIWELFVAPYLDGLQALALWIMNRSAFIMFSYEVMSFIVQIVILISTFKIAMWVFSAPENLTDHTTQ